MGQNQTTGTVQMVAKSVAEILSEHVTLSVESIDRMYPNVYGRPVGRLSLRHLHPAGRVLAHPGARSASPRPAVLHLFHALLLFRLLADGFRSADLRHHLADLRGCLPQSFGRGAITYQLRRLRLHGMIERMPRSHRYRVTDLGSLTALFFTRTYNRLLRPGLAAVLPGHAAALCPLKLAFDRLDTHIQKFVASAKLALSKLDTFACNSFTQAQLGACPSICRRPIAEAG